MLKGAALRRLPIDLTSWFAQLPDETKFHKDVGEWGPGERERSRLACGGSSGGGTILGCVLRVLLLRCAGCEHI